MRIKKLELLVFIISFNLDELLTVLNVFDLLLLTYIAKEEIKISGYVDKKYYLLFGCVFYMRTKYVSDNYRNE